MTGRVVALDVGGMSIRSGLVGPGHAVDGISKQDVDHRADAGDLLDALASSIRQGRLMSESGRVAVAVPGPFDLIAGVSLMEHKFAALRGLELRPALTQLLEIDLDIRFTNDAAAAGAGEVLALDTPGSTLVLTLGTGLGASLFADDALVTDVGDVCVADLWSTELPDGGIADQRFSASGLAAHLGVSVRNLPQAVADSAMMPNIQTWGQLFGQFIEMQRRRLGFDRAIIGGGASAAFARFGPAAESATHAQLHQATLGSSGPLLGAAALTFDLDSS